VVVVVVVVVEEENEQVVLTCRSIEIFIVSPCCFKMGLRYYAKPGVGYQAYWDIHPHVF
jgi:hypothetical protein